MECVSQGHEHVQQNWRFLIKCLQLQNDLSEWEFHILSSIFPNYIQIPKTLVEIWKPGIKDWRCDGYAISWISLMDTIVVHKFNLQMIFYLLTWS